MTDEQQTPPTETETGIEKVISLDPTAAAIKVIGSQPWAKEAGLTSPSTVETAAIASPDSDEQTDEVITKGTVPAENTEAETPHVSMMEDSGMGTWTGSPDEGKGTIEDTQVAANAPPMTWGAKSSDIAKLGDFGSIKDKRTDESAPELASLEPASPNIPTPVWDLPIPKENPTATTVPNILTEETTTTTPPEMTTTVPGTTVPPSVPMPLTVPGHTV